MKINDAIFGELEYNYIWFRDITIDFNGKETVISLSVNGEEDGKFDEVQYEAYNAFIKNWKQIQHDILQPILDYYNKTRYELGYDVGFNENYPVVDTTAQILEMVKLDGISIPYGGIYEGRGIGLAFECTWDTENGLGVLLIDEQVTEVGYQDVIM
ncbi:DUF6985 domain-containing protein [Cohnella panacarvi]|uniref:DUF6985 domain-containing protein n=1 Tax=Cohnella panacarvi TaxID=400776 RepID=UPI000479F9B3|nr:DUF2004 domain-containing protein [Cohnella panacarvi]